MKTKILALIITVLFSGLASTAQDWEQIIKTAASDRATEDEFGCSVAISGDYAVVGSWFDDEDENDQNTLDAAGSVYILQKNGGTWQQIQKIVASDRDVNDHFGYSVAISGNYIFIGAPYENEDANGENTRDNAGSVYIFQNNEGNWEETQKIAASNRMSSDFFGNSIAISGNYMVIGAENQNYDENNDNFMNNAGAAFIFYNNSGTWEEVKKITAPDREENAKFGTFVSISGNYAIVGAPSEKKDINGVNPLDYAGAAYIYSNESGSWQFVQKLAASDREAYDNFGCTVTVFDTMAIIGARSRNYSTGAVYCFHNTNGIWEQQQIMVPSDANDSEFGYSVSISGDFAVIGARNGKADVNGNNILYYAGSAYIIRNNEGTWEHVQKLVASDRDADDQFGLSVAISDNFVIAGSRYEDEDENSENTLNNAGSIYIFSNLPTITKNPVNKINYCPGSTVQFEIEGINIDEYSWQVLKPGEILWEDLTNDEVYSGVNEATLNIVVDNTVNFNKYRCKVLNANFSEISDIATLTLDEDAPQITSVHNNITIEADDNCEATIPDYTSNVVATDNCDTDLDISQTPEAGTIISGATNPVTLTVTDDFGNRETVSFNIEVVDNTYPTISCVGNQTIALQQGQTAYTVSGSGFDISSMEDNCEIASVTNDYNNQESLDGAQFTEGTTKVTWTVTDNAGNSSSCSFDVIVSKATGISNIPESEIIIFPNPVKDYLIIESEYNTQGQISIFDLNGKKILNKTIVPANETFDLSFLKKGIYILSIQHDDKILTSKFIKE